MTEPTPHYTLVYCISRIQNEMAHCPSHQVYMGRTLFLILPFQITHLILSSVGLSSLLSSPPPVQLFVCFSFVLYQFSAVGG